MIISWTILVISILIIVIFPVNYYLATRLHKIKYLKEMKNKKLSWLISFSCLYVTLILMLWNSTNAYIIVLHFFFIVVIGEFIYHIVCMFKKKIDFKYGQEITLSICLIFTIIYLGVAYYIAHNVIETHYDIVATKDIGVENFRIVQITDSHIGATMNGDKFYNYMLDINKTNPDIVVITGDFVDDDTNMKDLIRACEGLGVLKTKYGVYFVFGNHDKGYFKSKEKELREELEKNNVTILEDEGLDIVGNIYLLGRQDKQVKNRKTAQELMNEIDKSKYIVVLDHQPNDYKNESESKMDLVISGHTHGGQIFPLQIFDKMVGANNQIYGIETRDNTTFIVSSGIGDWAVKFKTGTVAEYVVIDIKNKS